MHSNTGVLGSIPLLATLELIDKVGFDNLRDKADRLTGALDALLRQSKYYIPADKLPKGEDDNKLGFHIITPELPFRGTQLSLFIHPAKKGIMPRVFEKMLDRGLVGDERFPYVIRLSPIALYNTFQDVGRAAEIVEEALAEVEQEGINKA
jgi:kynureninase